MQDSSHCPSLVAVVDNCVVAEIRRTKRAKTALRHDQLLEILKR